MAKRGGGSGRKYVRDSIGRFASKGYGGQTSGRGARLKAKGKKRAEGGAIVKPTRIGEMKNTISKSSSKRKVNASSRATDRQIARDVAARSKPTAVNKISKSPRQLNKDEKIARDVMTDKRFKSDRQRATEMLKRGIKPGTDVGGLVANVRSKQGGGTTSKIKPATGKAKKKSVTANSARATGKLARPVAKGNIRRTGGRLGPKNTIKPGPKSPRTKMNRAIDNVIKKGKALKGSAEKLRGVKKQADTLRGRMLKEDKGRLGKALSKPSVTDKRSRDYGGRLTKGARSQDAATGGKKSRAKPAAAKTKLKRSGEKIGVNSLKTNKEQGRKGIVSMSSRAKAVRKGDVAERKSARMSRIAERQSEIVARRQGRRASNYNPDGTFNQSTANANQRRLGRSKQLQEKLRSAGGGKNIASKALSKRRKPVAAKPAARSKPTAAKPAAAKRKSKKVSADKVNRIIGRLSKDPSRKESIGMSSRTTKSRNTRETRTRALDFMNKAAGLKLKGKGSRPENPKGLNRDQMVANIAGKLAKPTKRSTLKNNSKVVTQRQQVRKSSRDATASLRSSVKRQSRSAGTSYAPGRVRLMPSRAAAASGTRPFYTDNKGKIFSGRTSFGSTKASRQSKLQSVRKLRGTGGLGSSISQIKRSKASQRTIGGGIQTTFGKFRTGFQKRRRS